MLNVLCHTRPWCFQRTREGVWEEHATPTLNIGINFQNSDHCAFGSQEVLCGTAVGGGWDMSGWHRVPAPPWWDSPGLGLSVAVVTCGSGLPCERAWASPATAGQVPHPSWARAAMA